MSRRCGGMAFSAPRPAPPHPPPRDGAAPAAGEACIVADASTGAVAVTAGGRDLLRVEAGLLKGLPEGTELLMCGEAVEGPVWVLSVPSLREALTSGWQGVGALGDALGTAVLQPLRALMMAAKLSPTEESLAGAASALVRWHSTAQFCGKCGAPTRVASGGRRRKCTRESCGRTWYPRTDPVCIMLVTDGDRCLLGRYKASPPGMWTCLAGFVEQAERLETAVAREVLEESGVEADEDSVEIVGSQAWPCGRGGSCELMLGCAVRAKAGTPAELGPDLQLDDNMAGVRWASRAEARGMVEASMDARAAAAAGKLYCPPPWAIAHMLIRKWAEGGQGGGGRAAL